MIRGQKPKAAKLKMIQGNPGHRPITPDLEVPGDLPVCPSDLDPEAKAEWARVTSLLPIGVLASVDLGVLSVYCQSYARWLAAERMSAKETPNGVLILRDDKGVVKSVQISPFLNLAVKYREGMLRAASEIGLTPSARTRLGPVSKARPESPWDATKPTSTSKAG